uniref:Large ribosomal subunit protein eL28 n=1 Tax=Phoronis muelleri TaxID=478209 RepID=B2YI46_9BILA|nr:putative 60S ribosomal protein RPL28 [Phoronis muelleri]
MSADLQWLIVRNNSAFTLKNRLGANITFNREANNLKGVNSFRYSGLVQQKTVSVEPCADGKGVALVTRKTNSWRKPAKSLGRVELKKGSRRALNTIRKTLGKSRYRKDLKMAALKRASILLRSQKPVVAKAGRKK